MQHIQQEPLQNPTPQSRTRLRRMQLQRKAELLSERIFLGGPVRDFERLGRLQLSILLEEGLYPDSRVLDIGCGCLRGGYWLIHFLQPGCYFGIEPNRDMLEQGRAAFLEPELLEVKRPTFDHNASFDFSVFDARFDFFLARSVWSHASREQIRCMLDGFVAHGARNAVFLTSYLPTGLLRYRSYTGTGWIGRSHESDAPGMIHHSLRWIRNECSQRELCVRELTQRPCNRQTWLRIERAVEVLPSA